MDTIACSSFVTEDAPSCLYCAFAEARTGIFARNDSYFCNKKNKMIKPDDLACSGFVEDRS